MSRLHVHLGVEDLDAGVRFYTALFGTAPDKREADYARWRLQDPKVHFALSTRGRRPGLDHIGIQADSPEELGAIRARIEAAGLAGVEQSGATCCYARSDKYWTLDPQGVPWETFHTLDDAPVFSDDGHGAHADAACCPPTLPACCG